MGPPPPPVGLLKLRNNLRGRTAGPCRLAGANWTAGRANEWHRPANSAPGRKISYQTL